MLRSLIDDETLTNVYLFVCDSLRLDTLPPSIRQRGLMVPTIAQGLCTPPSLASLVTGRYPPRHGVEWFGQTLDETRSSLFEIEGIETGFTSMWDDAALADVVGTPPVRTLSDVSEPFLLVEHDHGGHVNYPGYRELSPKRMLRDHIDGTTLRDQYQAGVRESVERFHTRLRTLAHKNLLAETLVIFTSDHGEVLDERGGFVGHRLPACPELCEVPTVFIHPALPGGAVEDGYIRHVDLFPSMHRLLTGDAVPADGVSLVDRSTTTPRSYTHVAVRAPASWRDSAVLSYLDPLYTGSIVWQGDGGYFFNESGRLRSALTAYFEAAESTGSLSAHYHANRPLFDRYQAFHGEIRGNTVLREPTISCTTAQDVATTIRQGMTIDDPHSLSAATETTLRALGYR